MALWKLHTSGSKANTPFDPDSRKERTQPAAILVIAVWFGLVAGLGEVSLATAAKFILHRYTHLSTHIAWMIPTAEAIVFALVGLIVALVIWRWQTRASFGVAIFVLALLGFLSVLLRISWLHDYAAVVLAAGLAVQTSRLIVRHHHGFYRFARLTLGFVTALVVILAIGVYQWEAMAERRALTSLPPAPAGSPNVLLIVMDTVRARNLSVYGYSRPTTPGLEHFARTGVRFENAISTAPWTLPSHAGMFTGRYPHELSADWHKALDSSYPTLAEVLSEHGYLTAGFVANTIYCSVESGLNRGFAHYEDFPISPMQILINSSLVGKIAGSDTVSAMHYGELFSGRKTAAKMNDDFLSWVSSRDTERPFFAFLNYFDAHAPYIPPKPFDLLFGPKTPKANPRIKPSEHWSESEIQGELDAYDTSIAYLDHELGILLEELERRALLENTLVIVTADHGEEFREHGSMAHGWSTYLSALHVPLLISFPSRIPSMKGISEPVTLRDLPATVIDLLGIHDRSRLPGTSLARYWNGSSDSDSPLSSPLLSELSLQTPDVPPSYAIIKGKGALRSLVVDRYHYIKTRDGREELYDLEKDPLEEHDIAQVEEARRTMDMMRTSMETMLARNRAPN